MIKGKEKLNYNKQLVSFEEFVEVKEPTSEKRFLRFLELFAAQKADCAGNKINNIIKITLH